jgi:ribosomal protein L40E
MKKCDKCGALNPAYTNICLACKAALPVADEKNAKGGTEKKQENKE